MGNTNSTCSCELSLFISKIDVRYTEEDDGVKHIKALVIDKCAFKDDDGFTQERDQPDDACVRAGL